MVVEGGKYMEEIEDKKEREEKDKDGGTGKEKKM
jgi:hypothetical protein